MFVALDLGGTNFRVLLVDLKGRETPDVKSNVFLIPTSIMLGPGVMVNNLFILGVIINLFYLIVYQIDFVWIETLDI